MIGLNAESVFVIRPLQRALREPYVRTIESAARDSIRQVMHITIIVTIITIIIITILLLLLLLLLLCRFAGPYGGVRRWFVALAPPCLSCQNFRGGGGPGLGFRGGGGQCSFAPFPGPCWRSTDNWESNAFQVAVSRSLPRP